MNNNFNLNSNPLVSNQLDNYFNELLKSQKIIQNSPIHVKHSPGFSKFYSEYIEHNILLLFIIFCLVIIFIAKYYYNENSCDTNIKDNDKKYSHDQRKHKHGQQKYSHSHSQQKYLDDYKKQIEQDKMSLEREKENVLSIINELSFLSDEKIKYNDDFIKSVKKNVDDPNKYKTYDGSNNNYKTILYDNEYEENNKIDGLYVEPPYE